MILLVLFENWTCFIVFQQFYMKTTGEIFDPPIWYIFKQNLSKNRCLLWGPPLSAKLRSSSNPSCELNGKVVTEQKCFFWKEFYSMVGAMEQSVIMKETDYFSLTPPKKILMQSSKLESFLSLDEGLFLFLVTYSVIIFASWLLLW